MTKKGKFARECPNVYFLDAENMDEMDSYLKNNNWLNDEEKLSFAAKAGEGNMNYTLRITTNERTFIIKQARPWVEKYDQIAAPWDRAIVEGVYYRLIEQEKDLNKYSPKLLGIDREARILIMEDLGSAQDFIDVYSGRSIAPKQMEQLVEYLTSLHNLNTYGREKELLTNREMRQLNHQHIFDLPLQKNNGLDLNAITPGLQDAAFVLQSDEKYCRAAEELGEIYLEDGERLLHGDYYPGSWLDMEQGIKIIDPEFCFYGKPEFDLGVMFAHMILAAQKENLSVIIGKKYCPNFSFNHELALQFAGIEIMRRLIGVAQLPLNCGIERKKQLLEISHELVLGSKDKWLSYFN